MVTVPRPVALDKAKERSGMLPRTAVCPTCRERRYQKSLTAREEEISGVLKK